MNTDDDNPQNHEPRPSDETRANETAADDTALPGDRRPLGYWLRAVDALLTREFAAAFESEGVTRRDWMLLGVLSGDVDAPGLAERLARKGKRLRRLEELGWAQEQGDGSWALTDDGRVARERLGATVDAIRARVAGAVSPEDFATTMASLEAIARELGWDEASGYPRGSGFGRWGRGFGGPHPFRPEIRFGWGPNLHHGFAPGHPGRPGTDPHHGASHDPRASHGERGHGHGEHEHGSGHGHGYGHGHGEHEHEHGAYGHGERGRGHGHGHPWQGRGFPGAAGHGHPHGHGRRRAERAYERGFAAGFGAAQGRPDADPQAPGTAA
jgi:hypothetical protein